MTTESRRQRHGETIIAAAAAGDVARATALLAEHIIEFPEDATLLPFDPSVEARPSR
jgi:DNA-binding GntR family transcriptional regulator